MVTSFDSQVRTIRIVISAGYLPLPLDAAGAVICVSAVVQATGSAMVMARAGEALGCGMLIGWSCLHPALYAQLGNGEFIAETVTVVGGLLILLSTTLSSSATKASVCLTGRCLLCAYFFRYAVVKLGAAFMGSSQSAIVDAALSLALCYVCGLIVIGSRSRHVAAGLAVVMLFSDLVFHPFWYYFAVGQQWMSVEDVRHIGSRLPVDLTVLGGAAQDPSTSLHIYDQERYFFFQRLSSVGALLLLAIHGPGRHAMDEQMKPMSDAE